MGQEDLLETGSFSAWVDVPDLEFAAEGANKKMISIDLVQVSGILLAVNLMSDGLASRLDVNIHDENLFVVEAGDGQNRGRCLEQRLSMKLNHRVTNAWLGAANQ